jgi:F0F1-type ATP synthase assembly protein I
MRGVLSCLVKTSATPGIVVVVGVTIGIVVGSYFGKITLGAFWGAGIGFFAGLALLMRMRKKRD